MPEVVLVLDAYPSSIRFALFRADADSLASALRGALTSLHGDARFRARGAEGEVLADIDCADERAPGYPTALDFLFNWLALHAADLSLRAVGHRLADAGAVFDRPVRVDASVLARCEGVAPFDPRQRAGLAVLRLLAQRSPPLPQVACFESAFHAAMPALARVFDALTRPPPRPVYGHGLACEDLIDRLAGLDARAAGGRTVAVHVHRTAVALCAIAGGRSVAATPDFGRQPRPPAGAPFARLMHPAGAAHALCYRIGRELGSLAAALGGLDAVVFAAEDVAVDADLRRDVLREAAWLGLEPDPAAAFGPRLSRPESPVAAYLVEVDPARAVARHAFDLLAL